MSLAPDSAVFLNALGRDAEGGDEEYQISPKYFTQLQVKSANAMNKLPYSVLGVINKRTVFVLIEMCSSVQHKTEILQRHQLDMLNLQVISYKMRLWSCV